MAYEKHTWETGEKITAEKLNNLEDGVSGNGGILLVTATYDGQNYQADKTFSEILEAIQNNLIVKVIYTNQYGLTLHMSLQSVGSYNITFGTTLYFDGGGEEEPSIEFYECSIANNNLVVISSIRGIR